MNKQINLDELKRIELNILKDVHKVCEEQNFRYSLCAGTLLGAVRHGGFIPWDDDIDIFMPRPDYDKLIEYCRNNDTPFGIVCHDNDKKYLYPFAKAIAKNTVILEPNSNPKNAEMGVYVDIFPIDGLKDTVEESAKEFDSSLFARELIVAKNWKKFFRSPTRSVIYEPIRFAFFLLSRIVSADSLIKKLDKKFKKNDFETSKYATNIFGTVGSKKIMETQAFKEYVNIKFEDAEFKTIKRYDEYLTRVYGDYMQLPPEDKRKSHHIFTAYYKD